MSDDDLASHDVAEHVDDDWRKARKFTMSEKVAAARV